MSINTMSDLLKKQDEEKQNLAGGVYMAWQNVKDKEKESLAAFNNQYENAPKDIREKIDKEKEDFFGEWGSEGRLATLMEERHQKEREKLVLQRELLEKLDKHRSKDQGQGR